MKKFGVFLVLSFLVSSSFVLADNGSNGPCEEVLDDFEDGIDDGWEDVLNPGGTSLAATDVNWSATDSTAAEGNFSGKLDTVPNEHAGTKFVLDQQIRPNHVSWWTRISQGLGRDRARNAIRDKNGNRVLNVTWSNNGFLPNLEVQEGGGTHTFGPIQPGSWLNVIVENINWTDKNFDVRVIDQNDNTVGSISGANFLDQAAGMKSFLQTLKSNQDTVWLDALKVSSPVEIEELSVAPDTLWPAPHAMVEVEADVKLSNPNTSARITDVSHDGGTNQFEPDVDLDTGDPLTVRLRAERDGRNKDGRTYTVEVTAGLDGCQSDTETAEVTVPHDQRFRKSKKGNGNGN